MKSFLVVLIENNGHECPPSGLRFATEKQAHEYHGDLYGRWTGCPSGYRIEPSADPVSAKYAAVECSRCDGLSTLHPFETECPDCNSSGWRYPALSDPDKGPFQCDDNGDRLPEPNDAKQVSMLTEASDRVAERHPDIMAVIHGDGVEGGEDTLARAIEFYDERSAVEYEKVRKENGFTFDI